MSTHQQNLYRKNHNPVQSARLFFFSTEKKNNNKFATLNKTIHALNEKKTVPDGGNDGRNELTRMRRKFEETAALRKAGANFH